MLNGSVYFKDLFVNSLNLIFEIESFQIRIFYLTPPDLLINY